MSGRSALYVTPPPKRAWVFWLMVILAAVITGVGVTAWKVRRVDGGATVTQGAQSGVWKVSTLTGSADADALTRARVAVGGLLALSREETLYYLARHDSEGRPLHSACEYRVSGPVPAARWWSITAYAEDYFLFRDAQDRYSVNSAQAMADGEGRFAARIGPRAQGRDGVAVDILTPGDRPLILTLRLYNPDAPLQQEPASLDAPRIERLGACP